MFKTLRAAYINIRDQLGAEREKIKKGRSGFKEDMLNSFTFFVRGSKSLRGTKEGGRSTPSPFAPNVDLFRVNLCLRAKDLLRVSSAGNTRPLNNPYNFRFLLNDAL